jgi:diaminohydroxyphosphoribosylaminopyrimidine deaminase / 5-amino-6-(5-phosphoribosylamino)uracil reductase
MPSQSIIQFSPANAAPYSDVLSPLVNADRSRPFVIAQLGQSLDGRIATPTGESRWINRDCALDHVHRLRANVDAVVVGIGTVLADDPMLNVRRVPGSNPARVVIDPNGRMDHSARLLVDDGTERIVICADARACPPSAAPVLVARDGPLMRPADIVRALFERGLRKILIEGGASTISTFIDADVVDRLHVLVAPMILGSGTTGLSLKAIRRLDEARRPQTRIHVLDDGDVLFDCDLRCVG